MFLKNRFLNKNKTKFMKKILDCILHFHAFLELNYNTKEQCSFFCKLTLNLQLKNTEGTWDYNLVSTSSINSVGVYPLIITLSHNSRSINDEFTLTFLAANGSEES